MQGGRLAAQLLPLIKPAAWAERAAGQGVCIDRLFDGPECPRDAPVVAYAVDRGDDLVYLQEGLKLKVPLEQAKGLARVNLQRVLADARWRTLDFADRQPGLCALALAAHEYAAEALLLEQRMREAHARLGAERLLACTPARGKLLLLGFDCPREDNLSVYLKVCFENWLTDAQPLGDTVWTISAGRIDGVLYLDPCRKADLRAAATSA